MLRLLLLFLLLPGTLLAQNPDPEPLGKGELFGTVGGATFENTEDWTVGGSIGFAYDAWHKPSTPLLFEYVTVVKNAADENVAASLAIDFIGAGLRFGGAQSWFGSFTGGFAKISTSITETSGGTPIPGTNSVVGEETTTSKSSATRPGLSFAGGVNLPVKPHWGLRFEVRGTTIKDLGAWMYGVHVGAYYRLGKKP